MSAFVMHSRCLGLFVVGLCKQVYWWEGKREGEGGGGEEQAESEPALSHLLKGDVQAAVHRVCWVTRYRSDI